MFEKLKRIFKLIGIATASLFGLFVAAVILTAIFGPSQEEREAQKVAEQQEKAERIAQDTAARQAKQKRLKLEQERKYKLEQQTKLAWDNLEVSAIKEKLAAAGLKSDKWKIVVGDITSTKEVYSKGYWKPGFHKPSKLNCESRVKGCYGLYEGEYKKNYIWSTESNSYERFSDYEECQIDNDYLSDIHVDESKCHELQAEGVKTIEIVVPAPEAIWSGESFLKASRNEVVTTFKTLATHPKVLFVSMNFELELVDKLGRKSNRSVYRIESYAHVHAYSFNYYDYDVIDKIVWDNFDPDNLDEVFVASVHPALR